jgi:tetratricopeptide (TPR) repeat protein
MRVLFDRLLGDLARFVDQREDLILLVRCGSNDTASLLAALRNVEQSRGTDIFLLFEQNFSGAERFITESVERLDEQLRVANEALAAEKRPGLAPLPQALRDRARAPIDRLRDAAAFARSLLPRDGGHRLVWGMCPAEIQDRAGYRSLIGGLVPNAGVSPWMTGVRLIFRDEVSEPADALSKAPRVRRLDLDLGPAAIEKSLKEEAEDPNRPEAERMQALLSVALLDYAHERYRDATSKYMRLLGYYQRVKDVGMQAFVVNAVGDVYRRTGNAPKAQEWYERALTPAADANQPVILATIIKNLADLAFEQKAWTSAEQYYAQLDRLSGALLDPEGKVRAMERRGQSLEKLGSLGKAAETWEDAAKLSRSIGLPALLKEVLEHMERAYRGLRTDAKLRAVQAELRTLAQPAKAS